MPDATTALNPDANRFVSTVGVFAAALALYVFTLCPTVTWGDSAWLSVHALWGAADIGTAGDHPLFLFIGHAFTSLPGEPARNVNLVSAIFAAMTVALIYQCGRRLGASPVAALIGASALAVSHAFWLHAVVAEVYTANAFFLALTLHLLLAYEQNRRISSLLAAFAALFTGLTNHLVLAAVVPAIVVFLVMIHWRQLLGSPLLMVSGIAVLAAAAIAAASLGETREMLWRLWVGPPGISEYFSVRIDGQAVLREIGFYFLYLGYQFPSVALVLGPLGLIVLFRRKKTAGVLLLGAVIVNAGVFIRHSDWVSAGSSKFVFYISDYVVFALLSAIGAQTALEWLETRQSRQHRRRAGIVLLAIVTLVPVAFYASMPWVVAAADTDLIGARTLPYRDNPRYFLNPSKRGEDGARRFGNETLRAVAPGAVIFADFTPCAVLKYVQAVERSRPDVLLCPEAANGSRVPVQWMTDEDRPRPIYVASRDEGYYDFSRLGGAFDLVPAGPIFEVRPR